MRRLINRLAYFVLAAFVVAIAGSFTSVQAAPAKKKPAVTKKMPAKKMPAKKMTSKSTKLEGTISHWTKTSFELTYGKKHETVHYSKKTMVMGKPANGAKATVWVKGHQATKIEVAKSMAKKTAKKPMAHKKMTKKAPAKKKH